MDETVTQRINRIIAENNGSVRDALCVTLAQLDAARGQLQALIETYVNPPAEPEVIRIEE